MKGSPERNLFYRHVGCNGSVAFDLSGAFCTWCWEESLSSRDYYGPALMDREHLTTTTEQGTAPSRQTEAVPCHPATRNEHEVHTS